MITYQFKKELYPKIALLKAAYNFTDKAYIHLDANDKFYFVTLSYKDDAQVTEKEFINEMLSQSLRHEIYLQTKNIRELLLARAMASSVVSTVDEEKVNDEIEQFTEKDILNDWFESHE